MTEPRSIRTNNPGAIEYGPFAQRHGATGSDGRFAIFPDMDAGFGAMRSLLDVYDRQGVNTVRSIIGKWAPSATDNNATDAYIKFVAHQAGLDPDKPLMPEQRALLPQAMAHFEAGRPVAAAGPAAPAAATPAPTTETPPAATPAPAPNDMRETIGNLFREPPRQQQEQAGALQLGDDLQVPAIHYARPRKVDLSRLKTALQSRMRA